MLCVAAKRTALRSIAKASNVNGGNIIYSASVVWLDLSIIVISPAVSLFLLPKV
jgi:hypothetical protein